MTMVNITLSSGAEKMARALASARGLSLESYISDTLEHQIVANKLHEEVCANRGKVSGKRFLELLNKAGGEPPMKGDEVPPDLAAKLRARRKKRPASGPPQASSRVARQGS